MSPDPDLVRSLTEAALEGPDQERLRSEMLAFAESHPDALLRTCEAGHFTGSALVVDERRRILLMLHTKAGLWLQPGGHADGEGDLAAVALREATEESGIEGLRVVTPAVDVDIHEFRPREGSPHTHLDVRYLVLAPPGSEARGNHESEELRWVDVEDLSDYGVDAGLIRLARAGLARAAEMAPPGSGPRTGA
jgi:8-oxo-dGTP pyrophosphatase MutT (NUDIX family)